MLAACAVPQPMTQGESCVALFEEFDRLERFNDPARMVEENRVVPTPLAVQSQRLRQAGCITGSDDLAALETLPPVPVREAGAAIPPTLVHVGVVTNMADDARVLGFFRQRGLRAYSIGSPALGRRVYVGPVMSGGAAADVAVMAREAGFVAPYLRGL